MTTSFTVNLADLTKILDQIKIAERNAAGESLTSIIGPDAALLPLGLRTVDGSFNHLLPGQQFAGAADQLFPRMLPPDFKTVNDSYQVTLVPAGAPGAPPGGVVITNNNYDPTIPGSHSVADADPRIISNLIVDQTTTNPAAIEAWRANEKSRRPMRQLMAAMHRRMVTSQPMRSSRSSSTPRPISACPRASMAG